MQPIEFPVKNRPELTIMVDDEDIVRVRQTSWWVNKYGYVYSVIKKKHVLLHRFIMEFTDPKIHLDHINGNKLDNRKENLRIATAAQNKWNTPVSKRSTSGYKGVYQCKVTGKWRADICYNGKRISLGRYNTKEEAAVARDRKASEVCGEFANLNLPDSKIEPVDTTKPKNSKYRGVYYTKTFDRWMGNIYVNKKNHKTGHYKTEHEAAVALRKLIEEVCPERLKLDKFSNLPVE